MPGCSACTLAKKSKVKSSSDPANTGAAYVCTRCSGDNVESKPVGGVCICAAAYGRPSASLQAAATATTTPAYGRGNKKNGGSNNRGPVTVYDACALCPANQVSGSYSDACLSCAAGYEAFERRACRLACTPTTTCASAGAFCGTIRDDCGNVIDCPGTCSGVGSTCDEATNQCTCAGSFCLAVERSGCDLDSDCQSGICQFGACYDECPEFSELKAGAGAEGCVCSVGAYGVGGTPPCTPCGEGATTNGVAQSACVCIPPRLWQPETNECACPPNSSFTGKRCRTVRTFVGDPDSGCNSGSECASGVCTSGACTSAGCPVGTAPSGADGCLCAPGTYSSTGLLPQGATACTSCESGSTTTIYGATECACLVRGAKYEAGIGCSCPPGHKAAGNVCLLDVPEECVSGADCASGVCAEGKCALSCPEGSELVDNVCACSSDWYGVGGVAPCLPCPGASTTNSLTGQDYCSCPAGKGTWSPSAEGCVCSAGEEQDQDTGACRIGDFRRCTRDNECASGLCSADSGVCVDAGSDCPDENTQLDGAECLCVPGTFGPNGQSPCVPCGAGSDSATVGSDVCECATAGAYWSADTNTCTCPEGETALGGVCLVPIGGDCTEGNQCVSPGICAPGGVCAASCPAGSEADAAGLCVCSATFFGVDGTPDFDTDGTPACTACGDGSSNTGTGNAVCYCSATTGESWNEVSPAPDASPARPPANLSPFSPASARPFGSSSWTRALLSCTKHTHTNTPPPATSQNKKTRTPTAASAPSTTNSAAVCAARSTARFATTGRSVSRAPAPTTSALAASPARPTP
jgi:hypothetical protein